MTWQNLAYVPSSNALAQRLRQTDPLAHQDCIEKIDRLQNLITNMKQAVDKQVRDNEALSNRISLNDNRDGLLLKQLGRTSPEVERLKLENYALQNQIKQVYVKPDTFFKTQTQPRKFEQQDQKNKTIRTLRKQLQIVRTECLKASARGINYMDAKKYQRLVKQNQTLRQYLRTRTNKAGRGGPLPPNIEKIIGVQTSTQDKTDISIPEIAALNQANNQLKQKIQQYNEKEKIILYQIQLRQGTNKQAKQLNAALRKQYAEIMNKDALKSDHMPDPLEDKIRKLETQIMRLRTTLSQQQIRQAQYNHQLQVAAQRVDVANQMQAMQTPLLFEEIKKRRAQASQQFTTEQDLDLIQEEQPQSEQDLQQTVAIKDQYPVQGAAHQRIKTEIRKQTIIEKRNGQPQNFESNLRQQKHQNNPEGQPQHVQHYQQMYQQKVVSNGYQYQPVQQIQQQQFQPQYQQRHYQQYQQYQHQQRFQRPPQPQYQEVDETVRRRSEPIAQIPTQQTIIINLSQPLAIQSQQVRSHQQNPGPVLPTQSISIQGISLQNKNKNIQNQYQEPNIQIARTNSELYLHEQPTNQQSNQQITQHLTQNTNLQQKQTQNSARQPFPYSAMFDSSEMQNASRDQSLHQNKQQVLRTNTGPQVNGNGQAATQQNPQSSRRNFNVHDMFDDSESFRIP